MPTGAGTIGADKEGTPFKEVVGGTSKTILLVEAKRDIPWTKPDDIEIDTDAMKPLPKFGGNWIEGIFRRRVRRRAHRSVVVADGSQSVEGDVHNRRPRTAAITPQTLNIEAQSWPRRPTLGYYFNSTTKPACSK